jgi:homospermidine synthase
LAGKFQGKILVLGGGSVSQCSVPLFIKHIVADPNQITILDFQDTSSKFSEAIQSGVRFVIDKITQDNLSTKLAEFVSAGDVLVDLAWNIDANVIIGWCHDNDVLYMNTSVEEWDPYDSQDNRDPRDRTLLVRHQRLDAMKATWKTVGPTAVVEHGANPGLVSHLVKRGLLEIADACLTQNLFDGEIRTKIENAKAAEDFATLSHLLGVKVIHISERDTQVSDKPKLPGEFVNTWSVAGLHEEGIAPAELGWGTHEKKMPASGYRHETSETQICLAQPGATTWVKSWVPNYEINGMVVRHGEAYTITKHLTVKDDSGKEIYRPTVHYAYCPSDAAIASLRELQANSWEFPTRERIMNDEIIDGEDRLGVLIMGHPLNAWWVGSLLSIHEARELVAHQSATTLQVAVSVMAAVQWMIDNPKQGLCVPDDLPWRTILDLSYPYLGTIYSASVDWTPLKNDSNLFGKWDGVEKSDDPWQFENFLLD